MIASLFLGLKEDLGLHFSAVKLHPSFRKCHLRRSFLPYSSNSLFNFAWSVLLAEGTNFRPLCISCLFKMKTKKQDYVNAVKTSLSICSIHPSFPNFNIKMMKFCVLKIVTSTLSKALLWISKNIFFNSMFFKMC